MRRALALVTGCLVAVGSVAVPVQAASRRSKSARPSPLVEVRSTYTADFGLPNLAGIAYDPEGRQFLLAGSGDGGTRLVRVSPGEESLGSRALPEGDPRTIAFDGRSGLTMIDGRHLVTIPGGGASAERAPITSFRLERPRAATFDGSGNLVILDAGTRSLVRMSGADPSRRATRISLSEIPRGVQAVAFNPSDGLFYVLNVKADRLYGLDARGMVRTSFTLRGLQLRDPASMTFAPTADTTDDPRTMDLFIANGKGTAASGAVTEVRLMTAAKLRRMEAASAEATTVIANLVQKIDTSLFSPASPDPSGIEYNPGPDRLMIVDSEVDEVTGAGYKGVNLWQTTRLGGVLDTGTTDAYTKEPTGLGFDEASSTLFISSDDQGRIFLIKPGLDGRFGTLDDPRSSIDVAGKYGVTDAEDPEFDAASGHLFFLDGVSAEVYRIDPVNGVFGDIDDVKTQFDVGQYGAVDVEGLGSDTSAGTLLVGDRRQKKIYEVTKSGALSRIIDANVPGLTYISGLCMAPASDGSGRMNYWIADRAVDNGANASENDGKVFEVSLATGGNTAPVVNSATIDQTTPKTRDVLTVTVSASDADGDPLTYSYQWNKNGVAIPGQTNATLDLSLTGNGDKGDAMSVKVTASDGVALGVKTSAQVTIVNSPPVFNQDLLDRTDPEGQAVTFSAAATDNDADPLAYQAAGLPPGVGIDPATGQISGTISSGAAASSPYNVSVTVQDNATTPGSATDSFTWNVSPGGGGGPNQAPVVNSVSIIPGSPRTNDTLTAQVDASDPDGDALTLAYQWIKNGIDIAGATGATIDLSVAGNGGKDDVLSVRATARDASTTSAPVTSAGVTVLNSPPTFGQDLGDRTDTEGDSVSVSAAATDADGDSLTYEASSLPGGLSINPSTGLISGTIVGGTAANSPYGAAITVRDATGSAIDGFSWTVLAPPTAPTGLVATPTTTGTVLSWDGISQSNLAGYNVYRSAGQFGPFTKLNGSLLTESSFSDTTAPRGTSYYRVTAVNTTGSESSPAETSANVKITLRSVATREVKDASGITVSKPSGLVAGDVMVAGLAVIGTSTIAAPSGWSLVRDDANGTAMRQAIYYKVATTSEPRSYKWTFSPRRSAAAVIAAYKGAASVAPIAAHDGQANPASTSITAPGVSTSMADVALVGFFGMIGNPSIAPPSNMFERAEIMQISGTNRIAFEVADALLPVSGPTGARVATGTLTQLNIGQLVALRPLD